jgi:hypothetical protein
MSPANRSEVDGATAGWRTVETHGNESLQSGSE